MKKQAVAKRNIITLGMALLGLFALTTCRMDSDSAPPSRIEQINFEQRRVNIMLGEEVSVRVNATPVDGRNNETIQWSLSQNGIIELNSQSNNGVVMRGLNPGQAVIIARSANVTAYLEVVVEGGIFIGTPHIMVGEPVLEIVEGQMRHVQVNLFGGSVLDNFHFEYTLEEGRDHIRIDTTGNSM